MDQTFSEIPVFTGFSAAPAGPASEAPVSGSESPVESEQAPAAEPPPTAKKKRRGQGKSRAGLEASSWNAVKDGLRSEKLFPAALQERIDRCYAAFTASYRPVDETEDIYVYHMSVASAKLEYCTAAEIAHLLRIKLDASDPESWDDERQPYIESLGKRLRKEGGPALAALRKTKLGAIWLLQSWQDLGRIVAANGGITESQRDWIFCLLGIPQVLRAGNDLCAGRGRRSGPDGTGCRGSQRASSGSGPEAVRQGRVPPGLGSGRIRDGSRPGAETTLGMCRGGTQVADISSQRAAPASCEGPPARPGPGTGYGSAPGRCWSWSWSWCRSRSCSCSGPRPRGAACCQQALSHDFGVSPPIGCRRRSPAEAVGRGRDQSRSSSRASSRPSNGPRLRKRRPPGPNPLSSPNPLRRLPRRLRSQRFRLRLRASAPARPAGGGSLTAAQMEQKRREDQKRQQKQKDQRKARKQARKKR